MEFCDCNFIFFLIFGIFWIFLEFWVILGILRISQQNFVANYLPLGRRIDSASLKVIALYAGMLIDSSAVFRIEEKGRYE